MQLKALPHKQERALATRSELIAAAREIFARDGFESARIEDIAAKAGKTRGAFYANFSDKEDVFFAIFEEDVMLDQGKISAALAAATSLDERVEALVGFLAEILDDRQRVMLNIEFKMYVIRSPHKRKRLSHLYSEMKVRCAMTEINDLFPELIGAELDQRRRLTMEVGAVMDGLALNSLFSPENLTVEQRKRYLRIVSREALRAAESAR
jgi:AcrR family transcriptional regulator